MKSELMNCKLDQKKIYSRKHIETKECKNIHVVYQMYNWNPTKKREKMKKIKI